MNLFILVCFFSYTAYAEKECLTDHFASASVNDISNLSQKIITDANCLDWKNAPEGKSPEEKLKKMMSHLPEKEIFKRLILSEAYASGAYSKDLAEGIAWVLKNRVDLKNEKSFGIGVGVVFKPYQFRSSTGNCDVAKRDVFLCPTSVNKQHVSEVSRIFDRVFSRKMDNPLPQSYNYFFLKHFDNSKDKGCAKWKGVLPAWAKDKKIMTPKTLKIDSTNTLFYKNY